MIIPLKNSERKNRTVIREMDKGDIGLLYAEYEDGEIDWPDMNAKQFLEYVQSMFLDYDSRWIVEDSGAPIALISIKSNGWMIEPHVDTFRRASKAAIYRGFMMFFKDINARAGCCLVRTLSDTRHVFERLKRHNMLSYVGEIPNGDSRGTVYLYCKPGSIK